MKIVNEDQDDWDEKAEPILLSYRVAKHRSTGYSPFFLMYHREARLPIDAELVPSKDEDGLGLDDYVDAIMKVKNQVKPKAMAVTSARHRTTRETVL